MSFYGHGFKLHVGDARRRRSPDRASRRAVRVRRGDGDADRACSSAVGGFDERYFMFFEDVDLGWRLWLLGYRVRYVPDVARVPPPPRVDGRLRRLARALPARAQRAVHDLQELRRREPRARCCRPRSCSRSAAGVALGDADAAHARPAAGQRRRAGAGRPAVVEADARRRRTRSTRSSSSSTALAETRARAPGAPGAAATTRSCRLFRLPVPPEHRRPAVRRRRSTRSSTRSASSERVHRAPPHRRRDRRHARARDGRPGDPGLADRRARCRREHDVELVTHDRVPRHLAPRLPGPQGQRRTS